MPLGRGIRLINGLVSAPLLIPVKVFSSQGAASAAIDLAFTGIDEAIADANSYVCPCPGRVFEIILRSSLATSGATVIDIDVAPTTTAVAVTRETATLTIDAADTSFTQAFVEDLHFQTGELLQINCDPAGNSGNLFGHILLELYFGS